jgi:hypothetical protein
LFVLPNPFKKFQKSLQNLIEIHPKPFQKPPKTAPEPSQNPPSKLNALKIDFLDFFDFFLFLGGPGPPKIQGKSLKIAKKR